MPFDQSNHDMGKVLRKAGKAHLSWTVISEEAEQFVQDLFDLTQSHEMVKGNRKRPRNRDQIKIFKACLATWAAALIRHSQNADAQGYLFSPSCQDNTKGTCMTDRGFRSICETWRDLGLHQDRKAFQQAEVFEGDKIKGKRWAKRYRATPKLLDMAAIYSIHPDTLDQHFCTNLERFKPLRLRARRSGWGERQKGKIMAFPNTAKVQKLSEEIRQFNAYLAAQEFEGMPQPLLSRCFNNGDDTDFRWNKGGRFYANGSNNYQSMKSAGRRKITINGQATVELDVRASHLTLAYGLLREYLDVDQDPYIMPGLDRWLAKKVVVAFLGSGKPLARWPRGTKADYEAETGKPFPDLTGIEANQIVLKHHPCLARLSNAALDWSKLQFKESEALFRAMRILRDNLDTPSLPVHDSLIVPANKASEATEILEQAFWYQCGIYPRIEEK
ncbi:hypothetical protein [Primorskyibacter marinus]|uniref:hypothetical protein n=1 Tax=Primorskyibacter marinus TaxID=1977320 RepID=UPI000E301EB8|nr:hypothetical protein [Primorskyibacter marinus]